MGTRERGTGHFITGVTAYPGVSPPVTSPVLVLKAWKWRVGPGLQRRWRPRHPQDARL